MDNATRRQILERVKQLGYPNTVEALQNPQVLDQYEQQLQAQSQQQQPIQQPEPVNFPTPSVSNPNYKVPQPAQSEAKPLVMSFNETPAKLMEDGGPKDPPKKQPRVISDPEEFKIANQAYADSLSTYNSSQNFINEINNVSNLYKKGLITNYSFSPDDKDSTWRPLNKLGQLQADNIKTRKSNPLYNSNGQIVAHSPVSKLSKSSDKIQPSDSIKLKAGPQPYLVNIYDAPKTKPVFQEAPLRIEPLPITKLPVTEPQLEPYNLTVSKPKTIESYDTNYTQKSGQLKKGSYYFDKDLKRWQYKPAEQEEIDYQTEKGKIKKYGGNKFEDGGLTDPPTKVTPIPMPGIQSTAISTAVMPTGDMLVNRDQSLQIANKLNELPETAPVKPVYYPTNSYIEGLRLQENAGKTGFNKKDSKWYPHRSVEGGTDTIGYGHKLTKDEVTKGIYSKGLTEEDANALLKKDLEVHLNNAKRIFNSKYGENAFDSVPDELKNVLVDYSYNGVLNKFPTFTQGIYNYSTATTPEQKAAAHQVMLKEYPRKTGDKLLTGRNTWTKQMLDSVPIKKYGGKKCYTCNGSKMEVLYNKAKYKK